MPAIVIPLEKGRDFAFYNCDWCCCVDESFHYHDHLSKSRAKLVQNKLFMLLTTNQLETYVTMKRDVADIRKPTNCACEYSERRLIVENENAKEHVCLCCVKLEFNGSG